MFVMGAMVVELSTNMTEEFAWGTSLQVVKQASLSMAAFAMPIPRLFVAAAGQGLIQRMTVPLVVAAIIRRGAHRGINVI